MKNKRMEFSKGLSPCVITRPADKKPSPIKSNKPKVWENYNEFLESPAWAKKRKKVYGIWARLGKEKACVYCFSKKHTHLHHRNYLRRLGKEKLADLMIICEDCHKNLHHYQKQSGCTVAEATKVWDKKYNFDHDAYKKLMNNNNSEEKVFLNDVEKTLLCEVLLDSTFFNEDQAVVSNILKKLSKNL